MRLCRNENGTIGIFVQIGPANTTETVLDHDLIRAGINRWWHVFNAQILGSIKAQCTHIFLLHLRHGKKKQAACQLLFKE